VFSPQEVQGLFSTLHLVEVAMVDVPGNFSRRQDVLSMDIRETQGGLDFGLGMFHFTKIS
jgi:hypothetical protein